MTLTSSITSVLRNEPRALALLDEGALFSLELHKFPRHFKLRKEGILGGLQRQEGWPAGAQEAVFSHNSADPLIVYSHCPAKKIREDVFK